MDDPDKLRPDPETVPWSHLLSTWWEEPPTSTNVLISRKPLPETTCEACETLLTEPDKYTADLMVLVATASPETCWRCRILVTFAVKLRGQLHRDEKFFLRMDRDSRRISHIIWEGPSDKPYVYSRFAFYRWVISSLDSRSFPSRLSPSSLTFSQAITCPWNTFDENHHTISDSQALDPHPYDVVSSWLDACLTGHGHACNHDSTEAVLPRRLLHIGANPEHVRLVEHTKPTTGRYNALSHCWGGKQPLRTTKDNIARHLQQIKWDTIPKTFQDAIKLTSHLGIHYIWIDSLCIIQDSEEDWAEESSKMCDVYENAYLTIAAASSPNSSCGLSLSQTGYVRLCGTTTSNQPFDIVAHQRNHNDFDTTDPGMPLFTRAWVFQERILSRRAVYFCADVLGWECASSQHCQCQQCHAHQRIPGYHYYPRRYRTGLTDAPAADSAMVRSWHDMVRDYTRLNLSFASDKLPALSGLAKRIARQKRPAARYLAGLWSDSLLVDLTWTYDAKIRNSIDASKANQEGRAPSWSWAAWDGEIFSRGPDPPDPGDSMGIRSLCTVVGAETITSTSDPTGRVSGGRLIISGQLIDAVFLRKVKRVKEVPYTWGHTLGKSTRVWIYADPVPELYHTDIAGEYQQRDYSSLGNEDIKCLPFVRYEYCTLPPLDHWYSHSNEYAMLLKRVEEDGPPEFRGRTYRRIGLLELRRSVTHEPQGQGEIDQDHEDMEVAGPGSELCEKSPGSMRNFAVEGETILII